jgi:Uma2 family endonuclease
MAMPDTAHRYTVAEVLDFPTDGNRYEIIRGELFVTPAPRAQHQQVLTRLVHKLNTYLEPLGRLDTLVSAAADISWNDETLVQPDIFVVSPDEVSASWSTYKTLLLAVEILSPSTARADRTVKRRLYQEQNVDTYWIVDVEAQLVEVWKATDTRPEIVTDMLRWCASETDPEVSIDVGALLSTLPA